MREKFKNYEIGKFEAVITNAEKFWQFFLHDILKY